MRLPLRRRGERHPAATAGDPGPRRSPALLALVFGVFLVIIGVTASAQAMLVSARLSTQSLSAVVSSDTALVRVLVNGTLTPADLDPANRTQDRVASISARLAAVVARGGMLRTEVRAPTGELLYASDGGAVPIASGADFATAASGTATASITSFDGSSGTDHLLVESLPLLAGGRVLAVFVVDRDAAPILQAIEGTRLEAAAVTLSAALVAAFVLYLIFRSAQRRLNRQTRALVEATRQDALTGLLNHGAIVAELSALVESARDRQDAIEIALVDVDGFRLLNDTHGHQSGDRVLRLVRDHLRAAVPAGTVIGRYGPDEFLVVAHGRSALQGCLDGLRADLTAVALEFEDADPIPVTVSVGVCAYPADADSVTALLSVGAMTLGEARASGGDVVRVANALEARPAFSRSFDVLQGLVIAIDTKDRYTKRHSEDVARYADFIAERLGLDAELRRAIRVSGLLHDIGKIGIPDAVLRKPAKLTAEEYQAFQQHVALGDLIVRDLPDIDLVRAGVRYHHERWDGRGYLEALSGTDIPLIARVLAVADAFSAMTTTRPYRKALGVDEALRRLEDAAGTQLEERLVAVFVDGVRSAGQPPLPGSSAWRTSIWTPGERVA